MVNPRAGTYTPSPAQPIQTGVSHSPHGSYHSAFSASASPSTNSPTGSNPLVRFAITQVYILLGTSTDDSTKARQLQKLIHENGMEVFQKYFSRLVVDNAPRIFPSSNRPVNNSANYNLLVGELRKVSSDVAQAGKIAESIETANEDLFRDFDLSTFMEHFKLDALEKTILALGFKTGSRSDLKTKADAILSANYPQFLQSLASNTPGHDQFQVFQSTILDRFIQEHPPNFNQTAKSELYQAVQYQYRTAEEEVPTDVQGALYLMSILTDDNPLALAIHRVGPAFTADDEACKSYLDSLRTRFEEEQVGSALIYTALSRTHTYSPAVLIRALRKQVLRDFNWQLVVAQFDQAQLRISPDQFISLYEALRPLAVDQILDIQQLWGGNWQNPETQLSFVSAFGRLDPVQLDATTIPGLDTTVDIADFADLEPTLQQIGSEVARSTLVSTAAMSVIFNVALLNSAASETAEAKKLFTETVVPNLHKFIVSAFGVPKPWPEFAALSLKPLFSGVLSRKYDHYDFVLEALWRKDKHWVASRLADAHAMNPMELENIFDHVNKHQWLNELLVLLNAFGLDLAALAHATGLINLGEWARIHSSNPDFPQAVITFLSFKADHELAFQRSESPQQQSVTLPVKTVSAFLDTLDSLLPKGDPSPELIAVQRKCITAYPRLINYGGDYDNIIDANGAEKNSLPAEANQRMEEHYKRLYSAEDDVRSFVEALKKYKHSREPYDQDIFACLIHGLFDEYGVYSAYPLDALATTAVSSIHKLEPSNISPTHKPAKYETAEEIALLRVDKIFLSQVYKVFCRLVLFGAIVANNVITDLPLEIGIGMILEAVRDFPPEDKMYKFGLQALLQLSSRLDEWPGVCQKLLQVPGLRGTQVWNKAEQVALDHGARNIAHGDLMNGGSITNGDVDQILEPTAPKFTCLNVEPPPPGISDQPDDATQAKVLFVLNNVTEENLEGKFNQLSPVMDDRNMQWFAQLIVEERAKKQPNFQKLYLDLLNLFDKRSLYAEILRQTYVGVIKMLNSEVTMNSAPERSHLKSLGEWLGFLTLARDKPIKHKNIAFKQLLLEAFDTQRLIVVIPFVCRVLVQGRLSTIFKPPNPWLMDIIHVLMELYHHGELKLNLKFEIEVLCKDLKLDHKTIEPSTEIMSRAPTMEEATEPMLSETMDRFDNLSLNGLGGGAGSGRFSPQEITSTIPDLGPLLVYPPANDMVNQVRLQDILRTAITRAVHEIIAPVVERSVTIAAISTAQMIHKDFAIEPDEERVRLAATNMVKKTAGSLALVTSKEPLRASMMNYIRTLAQEQLPQGLPEGTIIMCVNSNLDLACGQVEKKAEERAVPEIEEMIAGELEARRHHQMVAPETPYQDPMLSRWALTIPNPYKLQPNMDGLNSAQLAIYDEFANQPRVPSLTGTTHIGSVSDATRSIANDILQDQYTVVPSAPTPAEAPALPLQQSAYPQASAIMANGRMQAGPVDPRGLMEQVQKILSELEKTGAEVTEKRHKDLPRQHTFLNLLDMLYNLIIRNSQTPEGYDLYIVSNICEMLFSGNVGDLVIDSLVHVLANTCRIGGRSASRIAFLVSDQPPEAWLNVTLVTTLINAEIVEWQRVDSATSQALLERKTGSLEFFSSLIDSVLLNDRPVALYTDLVKSLEVAWQWINEEPALEVGQALKQKLTSSGLPKPLSNGDERAVARGEQMEYVFEEWTRLYNNPEVSAKAATQFISQMYNKQIINSKDDLCTFIRLAIDFSVERFEVQLQTNSGSSDAYAPIDSLARLITLMVIRREAEGEVKHDKAAFLKLILSVVVLVLNYHHVTRGESFNQRVFCRLFSTLLCEFDSASLDDGDHHTILLSFAGSFLTLRPSYFPGFVFGWLSLVSHRAFLPNLMNLPNEIGWKAYSDIMGSLLSYVGDLLKPQTHTPLTRAISDGTAKLFLVLHHDFPQFLGAYHSKLVSEIPSHCTYLINIVLTADPAKSTKVPDPMQPGLKVDRLDEIRDSPHANDDIEGILHQRGLFEVLDQALQNGSVENAIAVIAYEIQKKGLDTGFGFVPVNVDLKLINSVVVFVGRHGLAKAQQNGGPNFTPEASPAIFLSMLVHELGPEARYYLISSIVNQLRSMNNETHYFLQALLTIWGMDPSDNEESDIREQITRVLLERLLTHWPQPWGVIVMSLELIKNEQYGFFDMAFIKQNPEVGQRFTTLATRQDVM